MRVVPLLVLLVCGLTISAAPDLSVANEPAAAVVASAADEADYQALQQQADLALDLLKLAQERRLAAMQLAIN